MLHIIVYETFGMIPTDVEDKLNHSIDPGKTSLEQAIAEQHTERPADTAAHTRRSID